MAFMALPSVAQASGYRFQLHSYCCQIPAGENADRLRAPIGASSSPQKLGLDWLLPEAFSLMPLNKRTDTRNVSADDKRLYGVRAFVRVHDLHVGEMPRHVVL